MTFVSLVLLLTLYRIENGNSRHVYMLSFKLFAAHLKLTTITTSSEVKLWRV